MCVDLLPWKNSKSGSVRGYQGVRKHYLEPFCLFFEIFCLFLQFSTLESCYIWFTISLEYSSAYVYSCCPGKIQNQGVSGGTKTLFWAIFAYFLRFFPEGGTQICKLLPCATDMGGFFSRIPLTLGGLYEKKNPENSSKIGSELVKTSKNSYKIG